jgi:putative membrane protein
MASTVAVPLGPASLALALAPGAAALAVAWTLAGVCLGAVSGLVPGLHANNFALVLASVAPGLPGTPLQVGAAVLAAGVVHTFLDVVPALALGVPDAAMAATALPGHRLVLAGRGREALRLSALGSGAATVLAVPVAVPVTAALGGVRGDLRAALPALLAGVVVLLVATESSPRAAVGGALSLLASAALGWATLDRSYAAPLDAGGVLTPLFAGLFGAPVLLAALRGGGVPPQDDAGTDLPAWTVAGTAAAGTLGGALVGYVPGVSAAVAAVVALPAAPADGPRGFVVATSGANTATAVFALFSLVAFDAPRTGVTVALQETGTPRALGPLLAVTVVAAAAGFALVLLAGDAYLRAAGRIDHRPLVGGVLCLLVGLSALFAGPTGVLVLAVATLVGLVPPRVGARRVHLMGVLLGPLLVGG